MTMISVGPLFSENSNHGVIGFIVLYTHFMGISIQMTLQIGFKLFLSLYSLSSLGDLQ